MSTSIEVLKYETVKTLIVRRARKRISSFGVKITLKPLKQSVDGHTLNGILVLRRSSMKSFLQVKRNVVLFVIGIFLPSKQGWP